LFRRLVAIGLVSAATMSSSFAAGLVWSDDFESGNTSKWAKDGGRNLCTVVSTAVDGAAPAGGSKMAECNWNGIVSWDNSAAFSTMKLNSWNYSKEFLVRFKVRYASDVDKKFGSKMFRFMTDKGDNYYMAAQLESAGAPMFSFWETIGGRAGPMTYGDGSAFGADGKWHEVEIYVKQESGSTGVVRVWQDGRVIQQASNLQTITSGGMWYPMYIMSNWSNNGPEWAHDADNHVYWDSFEIYSDTGSGASGSLADGTIGGGGTTPPPTTRTPSAPTDARTN
jgi:hypothetical protein